MQHRVSLWALADSPEQVYRARSLSTYLTVQALLYGTGVLGLCELLCSVGFQDGCPLCQPCGWLHRSNAVMQSAAGQGHSTDCWLGHNRRLVELL
jgi:hypothetical protein